MSSPIIKYAPGDIADLLWNYQDSKDNRNQLIQNVKELTCTTDESLIASD